MQNISKNAESKYRYTQACASLQGTGVNAFDTLNQWKYSKIEGSCEYGIQDEDKSLQHLSSH
jgi:hypothetical protein